MPLWVVGGVVGAVVVGAITSPDYSDYSDYSDYHYSDYHSDYSDAVERHRKAREAREREFNTSVHDLERYVYEQINSTKKRHGIMNKLSWTSDNADFRSFEEDFSELDESMTNNIKLKVKKELKQEIESHSKAVREIDDLIVKINRITLLNQSKKRNK